MANIFQRLIATFGPPSVQVVPFKTLTPAELGPSILLRKGAGSSERTQLDLTRRAIIFAKV
jgi:hypothetical protein